MAIKKYDRLYTSVAANSTETKDYVVPNGETLYVSKVKGEAGLSPDTIVMLLWDEGGGDEELIFSTHGSGWDDHVQFSVVGDGVKILRIKLKNDQNTLDCIGLSWRD